jgi:hypothetical protein
MAPIPVLSTGLAVALVNWMLCVNRILKAKILGEILKIKLLLILLFVPIIIFSESLDLKQFSYKLPIKTDEIQFLNTYPITDDDFSNKYFLKLKVSEQQNVYPILPGKVISIEKHLFIENVFKIGIEHSKMMKSYYILSDPMISLGSYVKIDSQLGISIYREFINQHYMNFGIKIDEKYVYPELINLLINYDLDLLYRIQNEICETKHTNLENIYLNKDNTKYDMTTLREELTNDFILSHDNWENELHSYNFDIYENEWLKIIYLEGIKKPIEIQIEDNMFTIDDKIHVESTYFDVIEEFGLPSNYSLEGKFSPEIQNASNTLLEYNLINIDQIKDMDYSVKESGAKHYDIKLRLKLNNGIVKKIEIIRSLP